MAVAALGMQIARGTILAIHSKVGLEKQASAWIQPLTFIYGH